MVKKFTSKIKAAVFCGCSCCNGNIWPRDFQPGCNQRALQMGQRGNRRRRRIYAGYSF